MFMIVVLVVARELSGCEKNVVKEGHARLVEVDH